MPSFAYSLRALSLTTEYAYRENGVQFIVEFDNIGAQIPDCVMLDSDTQPITGNSPIFQVTTIQDFGVNRSWEVIPFDYLWAETTDPQIQVTIDGIEGICPTLDCHYAYVSDDEELAITSQSLDG